MFFSAILRIIRKKEVRDYKGWRKGVGMKGRGRGNKRKEGGECMSFRKNS